MNRAEKIYQQLVTKCQSNKKMYLFVNLDYQKIKSLSQVKFPEFNWLMMIKVYNLQQQYKVLMEKKSDLVQGVKVL